MPLFRQATPQDAETCYQIEISAYEGDEAATLAKIRTRIAQYPQGFLILEQAGEVVGFINSGCAHSVVLMDEFVGQMRSQGKATIHLMCKEQHVQLYAKMGYEYVQPSPSEHGGMAWHEMLMTL